MKKRMTASEIEYFVDVRNEYFGKNWEKLFDGKTLEDVIGEGLISFRFTSEELKLKINLKEL